MSSPSLASTTRPSVRRPASAADAFSLYIDVIDALSTSAASTLRQTVRADERRGSNWRRVGDADRKTAARTTNRRTNERCENLLRPDDGPLIEITPPIIVHARSTSDADCRRAFSKSVTYYAFVPALAGRSPRRVIWRSLGIWRIGEYLACPPLPPSLRTTIYRHWITNRFVVN